MWQNACFDLSRSGSRVKLRRSSFAVERCRIANQRRAVNATEDERVISLNSVAVRAAFHGILSANKLRNSLTLLVSLKSDLTARLFRRGNQLAERREDNLKLLIILSFERIDFAVQLII